MKIEWQLSEEFLKVTHTDTRTELLPELLTELNKGVPLFFAHFGPNFMNFANFSKYLANLCWRRKYFSNVFSQVFYFIFFLFLHTGGASLKSALFYKLRPSSYSFLGRNSLLSKCMYFTSQSMFSMRSWSFLENNSVTSHDCLLEDSYFFRQFNLRFLRVSACFVRINNDITSVRSPITLTVPVSKSMDPFLSIQWNVSQTHGSVRG